MHIDFTPHFTNFNSGCELFIFLIFTEHFSKHFTYLIQLDIKYNTGLCVPEISFSEPAFTLSSRPQSKWFRKSYNLQL